MDLVSSKLNVPSIFVTDTGPTAKNGGEARSVKISLLIWSKSDQSIHQLKFTLRFCSIFPSPSINTGIFRYGATALP